MKSIAFLKAIIILSTLLTNPVNDVIIIDEVPHIQQLPELARGCEVTSLAMLLNDAGVDVDKLELAQEIKKVPFEQNGYRGDPNEGFVGDIYSLTNPGYGVYHTPIKDLAEKYLPGKIVDLTGQNEEVLLTFLNIHIPVLVITNSTYTPLPDSQFVSWKTKNGSVDITYREHSVVITGYDERFVYINDPLYNEPNRKVKRQPFFNAWRQMGSQAISLTPFQIKRYWTKEDIPKVAMSMDGLTRPLMLKPINLSGIIEEIFLTILQENSESTSLYTELTSGIKEAFEQIGSK